LKNNHFYEVAIIGSPLAPLTYKSDTSIEIYSIVNLTLKNRQKQGVVLKEVEKPSFECEELGVSGYFVSKDYFKIIDFISKYYICSIGEATKLFIPFRKNYTLVKKEEFILDVKLSKKQDEAYQFLLKQQNSLLFGDTGSGKTEIYMKLFEKMIREGKTSLFLLPEIGLTPQIRERLKEKFNNRVGIWHSKITKKTKEALLEKIYSGEIKIIVGTRSALFVPLQNIGLIVVDEEHDDSYKSSSRPRVNVRDLALYFGKILNTKVVLGSATPSLSSYYKIPHFRLRGTYFANQKSYSFDSGFDKLSDNIKEKLKNLGENQAIIFLPTRANFKYLTCKNCSKSIECPYCSVSMSLHKSNNFLKCHYCNYTQSIPKICPECSANELINFRIGTSEVVEELEKFLNTKVIQKFDRDSITTNTKLNKILKAFNKNEIDIIVGTQMISKGHDYHKVKLAIILGIDALLNQADFRAREKAMALLFQIAGRSGRKGKGEVIIQTQNSDFFKAFLNDYELFLKDEITHRKNLYPPFRKILRFLISHKDNQKAKTILNNLVECISKQKNIEIIGYGESAIFKIANKYRYNLLLRSNSIKSLLESAYRCKKYPIEVDIDPINFS